MMAHTGFAAASKTPELELEESEADRLARALSTLSSYYPGAVISPKTMAWVGVISACGAVYGTRFTAIRIRMMMEKTPSKSDMDDGKVIDMTPHIGQSGNGYNP